MSGPGAHRRCLAAIICGLLCACGSLVVAAAAQKPSILLIVPVETRLFASSATLLVQIWNADQLDALVKNQSCAVNRNAATGADTIRCPPGVVYREVSPETFEFRVASAGGRIEIAPSGVRARERFRIRVSGRSADGCNLTFGDQTSSTGTENPIQMSLAWETTTKACGKGDGR
jgi:hypothetical protein